MTYTINHETNQITAHLTANDAATDRTAETFTSEAELSERAVTWPTARLIAIFNNLSGVTPVKKFTDRKTAISRIWKALQQAEAAAPEAIAERENEAPVTPAPEATQAPDVAPEETPATTKTTRAKKAPKAANEPKRANAGSKTASVLDLIQREGGASLAEIMEAAGWQAHSVRGFISGTLTKKMGLVILSAKGEDGIRRYTTTKA